MPQSGPLGKLLAIKGPVKKVWDLQSSRAEMGEWVNGRRAINRFVRPCKTQIKTRLWVTMLLYCQASQSNQQRRGKRGKFLTSLSPTDRVLDRVKTFYGSMPPHCWTGWLVVCPSGRMGRGQRIVTPSRDCWCVQWPISVGRWLLNFNNKKHRIVSLVLLNSSSLSDPWSYGSLVRFRALINYWI